MKKELHPALEKIIISCQQLREKHGFEYTQKCYAQLSMYSRQIVEEDLIEKSSNKEWAKQLCIANSLKYQFSAIERAVLYEVPFQKTQSCWVDDFVNHFCSLREDIQVLEKENLTTQLHLIDNGKFDSKKHVSNPIRFKFNEYRTGLYLYFSHI